MQKAIMIELDTLTATLIINESFSILFYTFIWLLRDGKIVHWPGYLAYGVFIGFLSLIINLLLILKYDISYFLQTIIVFLISIYMMKSSPINSTIRDNRKK